MLIFLQWKAWIGAPREIHEDCLHRLSSSQILPPSDDWLDEIRFCHQTRSKKKKFLFQVWRFQIKDQDIHFKVFIRLSPKIHCIWTELIFWSIILLPVSNIRFLYGFWRLIFFQAYWLILNGRFLSSPFFFIPISASQFCNVFPVLLTISSEASMTMCCFYCCDTRLALIQTPSQWVA